MKKIRIAIIAVAAITGISGAYGVNGKHKYAGGVLYFGVVGEDNKVRWKKAPRPTLPYKCVLRPPFPCTITSTSPESVVLSLVDAYPPQYTVVNNTYNKSYIKYY